MLEPIAQEVKIVPFHVRWWIARDTSECLICEWIGSKREPWNVHDFILHQRMRDHIGLSVECGEEVVAHVFYQLRKKSFAIKRMTVHPDWRRMGVATAILDKLKSKLSDHSARRKIKIVTSDGDLGLNLLLKKNEFKPIKHLKGCILWEFVRVHKSIEIDFTDSDADIECIGE
jgi:GNAT superfamily N-acetyltransferase